ncbi:MAG: oligosaccharide flippase family protein [Patescibacteria group bacterium]
MVHASGVFHKSVHGGKWFLLGIAIQKIIAIVPFFILARLLLPDDYGVMAVVFLLINILDRFTSPGLSTALVQKQGDIEPFIDTVWTFDLIKSCAIGVGVFFSGSMISDFFHLPAYAEHLIALSGVFFIIGAFGNPRQIILYKELDFFYFFLRDVLGQVANVTVAVFWAWQVEPSAWALWYGQLARGVVGDIMSYWWHPVRPRVSFAFQKLRTLWGYGKLIFVQNIFEYTLSVLDNIVVGRMLSPYALGVYTRARDLPSLASAPLVSAMTKVSFPAYAKIQGDQSRIREGFLKSLDILLFATIGGASLILLEGGAIISVLLGPTWLPIVVPLKLFSIGIVGMSMTNMVKPIVNALGIPRVFIRLNVMQLCVSFGLLLFLIPRWGVWGAAFATTVSWSVTGLCTSMKIRSILSISLADVFPLLSSISSGVAAVLLGEILIRSTIYHQLSDVMRLGWACILGVLYVGVVLSVSARLGRGPWKILREVFREVRRKRIPKETMASSA